MARYGKYVSKFIIFFVIVCQIYSLPAISLTEKQYLIKKNDQQSSNWTTGVYLNDFRVSNVTYCSGPDCVGLSPVGTLITHTITGVSDSQINYTRKLDFPNGIKPTYLPSWANGNYSVPRDSFEIFPPSLQGAMEHPLITTNITLLKEIFSLLQVTSGRNITILNHSDQPDSPFLTIHEDYKEFSNVFDDYNASYEKTTGWMYSFNCIVHNSFGQEFGEVHHVVITGVPTGTGPSPPPPVSLIDILILLSIILMSLILFGGFHFYRKRHKLEYDENQFFSVLLETKQITFLRSLYHKLIIGLQKYQSFYLNKSDLTINFVSTETSNSQNTSVIGKLFPPEYRKELNSDIRGRTVLILIELAFQDLESRFQGFLVKELKIPQQTIAFELKRLLDLDYIKIFNSTDTLVDTRIKYYELTHKGLLFLHILKDVISYTLIQHQSNN